MFARTKLDIYIASAHISVCYFSCTFCSVLVSIVAVGCSPYGRELLADTTIGALVGLPQSFSTASMPVGSKGILLRRRQDASAAATTIVTERDGAGPSKTRQDNCICFARESPSARD